MATNKKKSNKKLNTEIAEEKIVAFIKEKGAVTLPEIAASLGIADKVFKNFEKLFPKVMEEYTQQSNMVDMATTYTVLRNINNNSSSMMTSALDRQAQRRAAEAISASKNFFIVTIV